MKIHIIMHEPFESPGAILDWISKNNCYTTFTKIYKGDNFPEVINFDCLLVMGGPQSPNTTIDECSYFDSKKEISFIKKCIELNKFILGICLGAQLIGEALGAKYERSPNREIGVFPLKLTEEAKNDPIFKIFPKEFDCGHWHGDMPGLTSNAKILAYSEGCPRQIVRYSKKIYGFQCHFEFTLKTIESMLKSCHNEIEAFNALPYVQNIETLRSNDYLEINSLLFTFLNHMKYMHENEKSML